jgi:hypothetical protein
MPQGLNLFDASGNVILDSNFRAAKILGTVSATPGITTVNDSRLTLGTPFAFSRIEGSASIFDLFGINLQMASPAFAFSGSSLVITRSTTSATAYPCTVYYGIR